MTRLPTFETRSSGAVLADGLYPLSTGEKMNQEGTKLSKTLEQLCEEASRETDTQKLLALTQEINRLLEEREKRHDPPAA